MENPRGEKTTIPSLLARKASGPKIVCLTAYDYPTAKILDEAGVDLATQIKAHKETMESLEKLGHDTADWLKATDLAQHYGTKLYTGIFYRNPNPAPTFEAAARERHNALRGTGFPKEKILEMFRPQ